MQSSEEMVEEKSESFRKNLATTERKQDRHSGKCRKKKVSLTLPCFVMGRFRQLLCSQVVPVESWSEFLLGFIVARNELIGNISLATPQRK
jgi:hypothetical protein